MSNRFSLKDDGYATFKKIMSGRKQIGRVTQVPGGYLGLIGKAQHKAAVEDDAFRGVVARYCGYVDYDMMVRNNAAIRAVNKQRAMEGRYAAQELIQGNFEPFDRLLQRIIDNKEGQ